MVRLRGLVLILSCCCFVPVGTAAGIGLAESAQLALIPPASAGRLITLVIVLSTTAVLVVLWARSRVVPAFAATGAVGPSTLACSLGSDLSSTIAATSHELQTPISAILGYTTLLADAPLDPQQARHVETVRASARNLLGVVGNILELSRLDAGKIELEAETIDLDALLSRLYVVSTEATRGLLVRVVGRRDPGAPRYVVADRQRLTQVLLTVVTHAAATCATSTIHIHAYLSRADNGERLCFQLRVEGPGAISEGERARLLLPFRTNSDDMRASGADLHLAVSRRLVLLMGGKMETGVLNADDRLLWFDLPLISAPVPLTAVCEQTVLQTEPPARALEILVADDTPATLHVMTLLLHRQGHHVTAVTNGVDAISAANDRAFDLCLLDLRMDRVGGVDAAIGIRALPAPFGTGAIYALSARIDPDNHRDCRAAQMDGCLVKPLIGDELVALLNRVAQRQPKTDFNLKGAY